MKKLHYLIIMFAMILMMSGCNNNGENKMVADNFERKEIVLAIGGEPEDGFDPTTGWGRYGSPLFQSTLLKYDKDFNIVGDLATDYSVSDSGLQWTVSIREDALFSDGKPLTAEDVEFTFMTAKNSQSIIDLSNLDKIETANENTIYFYLKKPQSTFINTLISTGIVPKHLYNEDYRNYPIGSGPYKFVQWDKGQQLIVEKNPYYYGNEPYFDKLIFLFLSEETAYAAAKTGEVDIISIPSSYTHKKIENMKLVTLPSVDNRGVMFPFVPAGEETADGFPIGNDVTSDVSIRRAINIGINRQELVEGVLNGYGTPAFSVADGLPWWNPQTKFTDNRVEEAAAILEEGGWYLNENGVREKNGLIAKFNLYYPAGDETRQSLSMVFANMVKNLGIEVHTDGKSWAEIERLMYSNPIMMGWGSYDPLEMYNLYSSKTKGIGYYNSNYYENNKVDEWLQLALEATDSETANFYWQQAQWDGETGFSALGDAPWAWLVNLNHLYLVNENLYIGEQKIQPHGHGWPITETISEWRWETP